MSVIPPVNQDPSIKPYILRALYQWALDQNMTPQILMDTSVDGVMVPPSCLPLNAGGAAVGDPSIVLTIHPNSVRDLEITNDMLYFSARFGGKPAEVQVPVAAVLAIYCRENGRGIFFQSDAESPKLSDDPPPTPPIPAQKPTTRAHLKLVK